MDRDLLLIFGFTTVIILILSATAILLPFTRRLADATERYLSGRSNDEDLQRELSALRDAVHSVDQRMSLLEDRVDFTESLMSREGKESARIRSVEGEG